MLREQGQFSELLLRKDGGTAGCTGIRGLAWAWRCACVQEAGNHGNGLQHWLWHWQAWTGCCMQRKQAMDYVICVYECGCKDLGEDGQLCTVLLGRDALLSWHRIVSGLWSSRQQGCNSVCRGSKSCGGDYVQVCALVHMRCTRQDRFLEAPMARPTGFVVDVGDQDF